MDKKELERTWKKILRRSCLGDFNCMISPRNPYFDDEKERGKHCPLLSECAHEATERLRKGARGLKKK